MAPRRYATDTRVSVSKSREDIDRLLLSYKCTNRLIATIDAERCTVIQFNYLGRYIRQVVKIRAKGKKTEEQAEKEAWRRLLLLLKAKFESIEQGDTTFENEFLGQTMLPGGNTVADEVRASIEQAYSTGQVSRLLPALGGT